MTDYRQRKSLKIKMLDFLIVSGGFLVYGGIKFYKLVNLLNEVVNSVSVDYTLITLHTHKYVQGWRKHWNDGGWLDMGIGIRQT
jgi:hypothetical protein